MSQDNKIIKITNILFWKSKLTLLKVYYKYSTSEPEKDGLLLNIWLI
jgi:hypothetical protein